MKYNIDYDICGIAVIIVLILMMLTIQTVKTKQNTFFKLLIFLLLVSTVCDLLSGIFAYKNFRYTAEAMRVVNYIYFIMRIPISSILTLYILLLTGVFERKSKKRLLVYCMPVIISYILLIANLFGNVVFTIEGNEYVRGYGVLWIYIQGIVYIVTMLHYVIKYSNNITPYIKVCTTLCFSISVVIMGVQFCFQNVLVESFGLAICLLILYTNIQKPEEFIDGNMDMFNKKAFVSVVKNLFVEKKDFLVISVSVDESNYLERTFGIDIMEDLEKELSRYLNKVDKNIVVYHISDYLFYLVLQKEFEIHKEIANKIVNECDKNWKVGEIEIPINLDICIIKCPQDVNRIEQIFECSEFISKEEHGRESRIVYADNLNAFYGKRKRQIRHAIHRAIRNNSLEVYFQPIFSTVKKRVNSAEALVRLFDEEMGFISPEEFIPIAEEDGSILKIGNFVLETACKFMSENKIQDKGIEYIEVNVSVIECMKHDMAKRVSEMINKYGLKSGQINLEITETAALNSPEVLGINMHQLVHDGVHFSLDDYGSGYSNINYLINLPFNLIKVDKNIVWASFENERAGIALRSSVDMIRKLDYQIVAEGVETEEQAKILESIGCEFLQGYYFSRALKAADFLKYIETING